MLDFQCFNLLSFFSKRLPRQYIFLRAFIKTCHVDLLGMFWLYHLNLLLGRSIFVPIVALCIMVSPTILVILEMNVTYRYKRYSFNYFSWRVEDVRLCTSSIMNLSLTRWGSLIFVDLTFSWTLFFLNNLMKLVIHVLLRCLVSLLLISRFGNDVHAICWNQENMIFISFWVLFLCMNIFKDCSF